MTEEVGGVTPIRKRKPKVKAEAGRPGRSCHWSVPPPVDGGPTVGLTVYDADWLVVVGLRAAALRRRANADGRICPPPIITVGGARLDTNLTLHCALLSSLRCSIRA